MHFIEFILPIKTLVSVDTITQIFNEWDADGDEVLTMKEWTDAMKKPEELNRLPKLQRERVARTIEKAVDDDQNIEWQYWDIEDFVRVLQTPASDPPRGEKMTKSERKAFNAQERRWAPKVIETENADGTVVQKHTTGSVALSKDEFIERYHGTKQWNVSKIRNNPTQAKQERDKLQKKLQKSTAGENSMLSVDELEQIRIRLKQRCTTHNGVDVGQILKRRRWPVDRTVEPDEFGDPIKKKIGYDTMKEACQVIFKTRLGTKEQFAGFWQYLQTEENDKISYLEFEKFVQYKPRRRVARKKSVVSGNAEQIAQFSSGFRPDNNTKKAAFVGGKDTVAQMNPVLLAFRDMLIESSWKEELLKEHFHVFDRDGDGKVFSPVVVAVIQTHCVGHGWVLWLLLMLVVILLQTVLFY